MSQDLIIRLDATGAARWSVIARESGERLAEGEAGPEEALAPEIGDGVTRTLCLLPSEEVYLGRVDLPARSEREARQAAPYLIEEELASAPDVTEVSLGARDEDGKRWIAAADREKLALWRRRIADIAVRPVHVMPDSAALSVLEVDLALFARGADLLFLDAASGAGRAGGAVERSMERAVMPALLGAARGRDVAASPQLGLAGGKVGVIEEGGLDRLASRLTDAQVRLMPPLFGGALSIAFDWSAIARALFRPALLAAAALVLYSALLIGEGVYFRVQRDRIDVAAEDLFRRAFPDVTRVVNPQAQLNQRLASLGGGQEGEFLALMAGLAEISAQVEAVRIDAIRYDAQRGGLAVSAVYNAFEDSEALRAAAEAAGFQLEDGGVQQSGAAILGEFTLRRS
jgi:general secretion pathway protein L